ncbi:hypothetical protein FBD94_14580 [Pedobacter hiemivivus]|uniref:DUF6443 domain-containing protein n=1 Tax=Pedobacter hiemivivus TaxID=2530454 RepID=A0A4U1GB59_9SPHI|nr:DUF6443 domain-containing protein [Pedobacter hiemivivus]TKC60139.1 hypothetical protein FBD94_14580 [Pedobacter hiemivivus]
MIYHIKYCSILLMFMVFNLGVLAQNGYIQNERVKVAGVTNEEQVILLPISQKTITRSYTDGLGRIVQSVAVQASPSQKDIVQPVVYDNLGRQTTNYLPYASTATDGSYHPNAITSEQPAFYQSGNPLIAQDAAPYSQQIFENSPLQRVLKEGTIGTGFQPDQHHKIYNYRSNQNADYVIDWGTNAVNQGYYDAATLSMLDATDEDGKQVVVFKDKNGKTILERKKANQTVNGVFQTYFDTYYLYNEAGALVYIVPPKAISLMQQSSNWSLSQTTIVNLIFNYQYDIRGRLTQKTIPSKGALFIVYDPVNRPVLMQDANLRTNNQWNYIKYDGKGHAISQGIYTDTDPGHIGLVNMQSYVNSLDYSTVYYEERASVSATGYYSNAVFPTTSIEPLAYSYYDDYDLDQNGVPDYSYAVQGLTGESVATNLLRGLPTMLRKRTVGNGLSNIWLINVLFYNKYGQSIQKQSNNHLNYTAEVVTDVSTSVFDFNGATTLTKVSKLAGVATTNVQTDYVYDHAYRLVAVKQSYNGASAISLAAYNYNEIGQLIKKDLKPGQGVVPQNLTLDDNNVVSNGSTLHVKASNSILLGPGFHAQDGAIFSATIGESTLQSLDYRYNIRGQLQSINNSTLSNDGGITNSDNYDVFGMQLLYDQSDSNLGNTPYFSGALSAVKWMSKDGNNISSVERSYSYNYDVLNRLTSSAYAERTGATGNFNNNVGGFNENGISYDENGNILTLQRNSSTPGSNSHTQIDNLSYTYSSTHPNQLESVSDAAASGAGFMIYPGGNSVGTYGYDVSGNLVSDPYKGLSLQYNTLNKTDRITINAGSGQYIDYTYDASGGLLRKQVYKTGSATLVTDYVEGFVYNNNSVGNVKNLAYFGMPEGRVRNDQGVLKLEYVITDQQGNARVSIEDNGNGMAVVRQENSYYGFGMILANSPVGMLSDGNKHLYNGGSEWQNDYGNLPDYQQTFYRNYDAALGRFVGVDPLADSYPSVTGYQYGNNNPIMFNDPLGDSPRPLPMMNDVGMGEGVSNGGAGGGLSKNGRYFHEKWVAKLESRGDHGDWSSYLGQYLPTDAQREQILAQYGTTIDPGSAAGQAILGGHLQSENGVLGFYQQNGIAFHNAQHTNEYGDDKMGNSKPTYKFVAFDGSLSQEQELAKYGEITSASSVSFGVSIVGGVIVEYGVVMTNKNWGQRYSTVYYAHGINPPSISGGVAYISPKPNTHPVFSDWKGTIGGLSGSVGYVSGSVGFTSTYTSFGAALSYGKPFSFAKEISNSGTFNIGQTTLIGAPFHMGADFTNSYIKTQTYSGGR